MYRVIQHGRVMAVFDLFIDAWLFSVLDLTCFSIIKWHDGEWHINPLYNPGKPVH